MSRTLAPVLVLLLAGHPLAAQDVPIPGLPAPGPPAITAEEAVANAREVYDVLAEDPEGDPCANPEADEDTIIVCRRFEDGERYTFDRPTRADSRVTGSGAPRPIDFDESCLRTRGRENCIMFGSVPPPVEMVDFGSLPETPAGSDAALLYGGPTDAVPVAPAAEAVTRPDVAAQTATAIADDVIGP